jgi:hypothetical protein
MNTIIVIKTRAIRMSRVKVELPQLSYLDGRASVAFLHNLQVLFVLWPTVLLLR